MSDCKIVVKVRKVFRGNNALLVCLPVDFVRKTGIGKGDEVVIAYNKQMLTVIPNLDRITNIIEGEPKTNVDNC